MIRIKDIMDKYGVSRPTVKRWMGEGMPVEIDKPYLKLFDETKVWNWILKHGKKVRWG